MYALVYLIISHKYPDFYHYFLFLYKNIHLIFSIQEYFFAKKAMLES